MQTQHSWNVLTGLESSQADLEDCQLFYSALSPSTHCWPKLIGHYEILIENHKKCIITKNFKTLAFLKMEFDEILTSDRG